MDPNKKAPAGTLPGDLGLTEGQVKQAAQIVNDCLFEQTVYPGAIIDTLEGILVSQEDTPVQGIVAEIRHQYRNVFHRIAIRAFAAGLQAAPQGANHESGQTDTE